MKTYRLFPLAPALITMGLSLPAGAAVVFSDNFDAGTSGGSWTTKLSAADSIAAYNFDYGTIGIPSAPNSAGGSTVGMRFVTNQSAGVFQGVSATPNGQSFASDFTLTFDAWLNYVGPLGAGGNGTTQLSTFGWGVSGAAVEWPGLTSGVMFGATLDGGSAQDYRIYKNNVQDTAVGSYAAGSQNNSASYYTSAYATQAAPPAQLLLYPGQTGTTDAGEIAFKWRSVEVKRASNILTWRVDGTLIGTVNLTGVALSGSNIFFGLSDTTAGSSTDPNDQLITAIYDNIVVTAVPEPGVTMLGGAAAGILMARRRRVPPVAWSKPCSRNLRAATAASGLVLEPSSMNPYSRAPKPAPSLHGRLSPRLATISSASLRLRECVVFDAVLEMAG